jgi:hypothetical protein
MTNGREEFVVLRDSQGRYYMLPRATVEASRVADESVVHLEAILRGDASGAGEDVSGFGFGGGAAASPFSALSSLSARGIIVVGGHQALPLAGIRFAAGQSG